MGLSETVISIKIYISLNRSILIYNSSIYMMKCSSNKKYSPIICVTLIFVLILYNYYNSYIKYLEFLKILNFIRKKKIL
jgi:hypothetical protein